MINYSDDYRNSKAMELFGKSPEDLSDEESELLVEYIYDCLNPEWREVETTHGDLLEVSNVGQVRNHETKEIYYTSHPVVRGKRWYPVINLKSSTGENFYPQTIHQLVARAFIPNHCGKSEVNHIDGHKDNNWYKNLEWVTHNENIQHAYRNGLNKTGEDRSNSKYSEDQIRQVCQLLQDNPQVSFAQIQEVTGVNNGVVKDIYKRRGWKSVSKDYKFPPREPKREGENNGFSKYSEDQIRNVCQLLQDRPGLSYREIADRASVSEDTVKDVARGKRWTHVSKEYNIHSKANLLKGENCSWAKYTEAQVEQVCSLLDEVARGEKKYMLKEIAGIVGVSPSLVKNINKGGQWVHVSKNHYFYKSKFGTGGLQMYSSVLFTHDDLDGAGARVVFELAHTHLRKETDYNVYTCSNAAVDDVVKEVIYDSGKVDTQTVIVFCDIAPSMEMLRNLVEDHYNVYIYDHHRTNFPLKDELLPGAVIVPENELGVPQCGTTLLYQMFSGLPVGNPYAGYFTILGNQKLFAEFVENIRQYDTYEWKRTGNVKAKCLQTLFYMLGMDNFCNMYINLIMNPESGNTLISPHDMMFVTAKMDYEEKVIKNFSDKDVFPIELRGKKCALILHTKGAGISELAYQFLTKYPEFDIAIGVSMVGNGKFEFRTIKDDIDLGAEIAKPIGGGGHRQSAGAVLTKEEQKELAGLFEKFLKTDKVKS